MYQGATATGTPLILASGSSIPIQKVATSATGPRWSQFYPIQNLSAARDQIELFQANGARAIVVTVDQQTSRYERDLHDRYLGGSTTARRVEGAEPFAASTRGAAKYRVDPRRMWYSWKYLDDILVCRIDIGNGGSSHPACSRRCRRRCVCEVPADGGLT